MRVSLTAKDLADFEQDIAREFASRNIPHPVHLSMGNEEKLIRVFIDHVGNEDWIFCSWRSHLHCLLKGVQPERLKADIMRGRSMALCYPEYKIFSSAIVGGTAPIAVGVAAGLKMNKTHTHAVVFLGDMTAQTGIVRECMHYAHGHNLPVRWVIEDNYLSVLTLTEEVWPKLGRLDKPEPITYGYDNKYPHCGIGQYVEF